MKTKKIKVILGLSGGVDSAVAAFLLLQQGYDVRAVFMKNFSEGVGKNHECPWREDRIEAYKVAAFLKIPITTWNFEKEYKERVLDYMYTEYQSGRTPNPDIMCNKEIKFKVFLDHAKKEGAEYIATGHYAAIQKDRRGVIHLFKGKDKDKDQSYFLAALNQKQLRHVLFPLGAMTKKEVRRLAKKIGLPNADRPDSQGICFVGTVSMTDFLKRRIQPKQGTVVDTEGIVLGTHQGVQYFTIGQRKGIALGGGPARYVVAKDIQHNRLVVGTKNDIHLFTPQVGLSHWHWIGEKRTMPLQAGAKIRYRQDDQKVVVKKTGATSIRAVFAKPQRSVAAGQTLAVYKGTELIGSGIID